MVHYSTPTKRFATVAAQSQKIHTIKQVRTTMNSTFKFIKPITFGDITYYEVGINSWNQPEEAYMYYT
ncbi:hypothetical protein AKO1_008184 [Acrasis kona]|uniref:Uncharacterized protein n=1 Tax=Acrasis kona TaxID=1008807 RepID=A0AAW2YNJ1_9EUKA